MIPEKKSFELKQKTLEILKNAGIVLRKDEIDAMEITDLGLGMPEIIGIQIIVYVNNDRYCAKELVLLPYQTCPEHRHGPLGPDNPGKMETFRCRWGKVYLMVPGKPADKMNAIIPEFRKEYFTVFNEIVLNPGDQYTIQPDTLHWFQAGPQGAVISEFSSPSFDEKDIFTDPLIKRKG
ncbi:MAG: D-lyxose/D-mannose family sugar isomerase [Candidatus Omnitrophica bacterium]|nr:D-lyxose/D-mannose family sugar isomerase [Candidatus Omnitrophota bacterium]MCM8816000.1 D-lyxose/D-mannose family sugar isomerase [Candidatus Omnitrophota bacterium]